LSSEKTKAVRNAPALESVRDQIQHILANCLAATAFNKPFDFGFLRNRGFTIPREWSCPMQLLTPVCRLPGKYSSFKWPKVEEAWAHLFPDQPYIELHRGQDDAMHKAMIIRECCARGLYPEFGAITRT
jgi:hypothetical protein